MVPGMQGGTIKGAVAYDPTFGARTQSTAVLDTVAGRLCRDATLRAAEASVEHVAAATRAAATKINLVMGFLHTMVKPSKPGS
jgi:hypothetical protein